MKPEITVAEGIQTPGLIIRDPIEGVKTPLLLPQDVSPESVDTDQLDIPVDTAAHLHTPGLTVPQSSMVQIRDDEYSFISTFEPSETRDRAYPGARVLEIANSDLKLYLVTRAGVEIEYLPDDQHVHLSFEDDQVVVAARSYHETPSDEIVLPQDASPEDAMDAVAALASALKTTSAERAWPTLRGHPPEIRLGDCKDIPVESPDTGISLHIPPTWSALYSAAPLAYYLGADIEPVDEHGPVLKAGEYRHELGDVNSDCRALLQHVLFCDSVVRSAGMTNILPAAYEDLPSSLRTQLDPDTLYDLAPDDLLAHYLQIPFTDLEPYLPTWSVEATVDPDRESLASLPQVINELPLVRTTDEAELQESPATNELAEPVEDFYRGPGVPDGGTSTYLRSPDGFRASSSSEGDGAGSEETEFVTLSDWGNAVEQAYVGDRIPIGANKFRPSAGAEPDEGSMYTTVDIVCNDRNMSEEVIQDIYDIHDYIEIDVRTHHDLTIPELRDVIENGADFFHYIGHINETGIKCSDGQLDTSYLLVDEAPDLFLLNACTSYGQGAGLLDAGSIAGVATVSDIGDSAATRLGRTMARALNAGLPLRSALLLGTHYHATGSRYLSMGDGSYQLVNSPGGIPWMVDLLEVTDEETVLDLFGFPTSTLSIGTVTSVNIVSDRRYLGYGHLDRITVDSESLIDWFSSQTFPVGAGSSLYWSDKISRSTLFSEIAEITNTSGTGVRGPARARSGNFRSFLE